MRTFFVDADASADAEDGIHFKLLSVSSLRAFYLLTQTNYMFIILVSMCSALVLVGVATCVFNVVDSGRWTAVLVIALQIWFSTVTSMLSIFYFAHCTSHRPQGLWRRDDVWRRTMIMGAAGRRQPVGGCAHQIAQRSGSAQRGGQHLLSSFCPPICLGSLR